MSWNYRIVKYNDGSGFGLHEVYYDEDGREYAMTYEPATFFGETEKELREAVEMANADAIKRQVFEQPQGWGKRRSETAATSAQPKTETE